MDKSKIKQTQKSSEKPESGFLKWLTGGDKKKKRSQGRPMSKRLYKDKLDKAFE